MNRLPRFKLSEAQRAQQQRRLKEKKERDAMISHFKKQTIDKLSPEALHFLFYYNPREGILYWKESDHSRRKVSPHCKILATPIGMCSIDDAIVKYMRAYNPPKPPAPKEGVPLATGLWKAKMWEQTDEMTARRILEQAERARAAPEAVPLPFPPAKPESDLLEWMQTLPKPDKK